MLNMKTIRTRLLLCLLSIAGLVVLSTAVGLFTLRSFSDLSAGFSEKDVPLLVSAGDLSRAAAGFRNEARRIGQSEDLADIEQSRAAVDRLKANAETAMQQIQNAGEETQAISTALASTIDSIDALIAAKGHAATTTAALADVRSQMAAALQEIRLKAGRLFDTAHRDSTGVMRNASVSVSQGDAAEQVVKALEGGVTGPLQTLKWTDAVRSSLYATERSLIVLESATGVEETTKAIGPLTQSIKLLRSRLRDGPNDEAIDELYAVYKSVRPLLRSRSDDPTLYSLFVASAEIDAEVERLIDSAQSASDALGQAANFNLNLIANEVQSQATRMDREIATVQPIFIAIAVIALGITALIAYFYVFRSVVRRLSGLRDAMTAMAGGDLQVQVSASGADEIGEMARSVEVLRANSAEAAELRTQQESERRR
ncbi:MAG: HAMP domain-containing protein, partial [Pseudomonadota bacterium]